MTGHLIEINELARRVEGEAVLPFDCRFMLSDPSAGRAAFLAGHIPGAAYLDLEEDLSGRVGPETGRHPLPDRAAFAARMRAAGLRQTMLAVCYDDAGGAMAARAWWMLRWLGHAAVAVLDGGIQAWTAAGLPLETGAARVRPAGDLIPGTPLAHRVDTADIEGALGSGSMLVVDARTAARFAGEPHPLDPASGHIPGARSRFYGDNLAADGRFKPAEQLRAEWAAVLGDVPADRAVLHCGSGVTACHDLLAMEVAGMSGARLYPGSWSAWVSDPKRPIER